MPPPRLIRPLRPCHPLRGPLQARHASGRPRDTAATTRGDHTPIEPSQSEYKSTGAQVSNASATSDPTSIPSETQAQKTATKTGWWGSLVGNVSSILSGSPSSAFEQQQHTFNVENAQPSQPAIADEYPRPTSKHDKLHMKRNQNGEEREFEEEDAAVGSNASNTTTARESSTYREPQATPATQGFEETYAPSRATKHPVANQTPVRGELQFNYGVQQGRSKQDSGQEDGTDRQLATTAPLPQEVDLKQQVQELVQHVRQLQKLLEPLSIPQDAMQTMSRTTQRLHGPSSASHDVPATSSRKSRRPNTSSMSSQDSPEPYPGITQPLNHRSSASPYTPRTYSRIPQTADSQPSFSQDHPKASPLQSREIRSTTTSHQDESRIRPRQSPDPVDQPSMAQGKSGILPSTKKPRNLNHASAVSSSTGIGERLLEKRFDTMVLNPPPEMKRSKSTPRYAELVRQYHDFHRDFCGLLGNRILQLEDMQCHQIALLLAKFKEVYLAQSGLPASERLVVQARSREATTRFAVIEKGYNDLSTIYKHFLNYNISRLATISSKPLAPFRAKLKEVYIANFGKSALTIMEARNEPSVRLDRLRYQFWPFHARLLSRIILDLEKMVSIQVVPLVSIAKQAHRSTVGVIRSRVTTASSSTSDGMKLTSYRYDRLYYRYRRIMSVQALVLNQLAREFNDTASPRLAPLTAKVNKIILHTRSPKKTAEIVHKPSNKQRNKGTQQAQAQQPTSELENAARNVVPDRAVSSVVDSESHEHRPLSLRKDHRLNMMRDADIPGTTQRTTTDNTRAHLYTDEHEPVKVEMDIQQIITHNSRIQTGKTNILKTILPEQVKASQPRSVTSHDQVEKRYKSEPLSGKIQTQSRAMSSSKHSDSTNPSKQAPATRKDDEVASSLTPFSEADATAMKEISLLEELFPEASSYIQPSFPGRSPYPKLDLPSGLSPLVHRHSVGVKKSLRERVIESFQKSGERITALQFLNCSTEFTESDFRRLVPKGKHIESWASKGDFYKIIPGRDPLSLERLPFYYLLFKTTESALAYQANVARLHKLCTLRQASNIMSVMPVPKGLLEDGEDISAAMSSYLLKPSSLRLNLNMVMQPYNPSLRTLYENGGYKPIVPSVAANGNPLYKVLFHINGWEPTAEDLFKILYRHARARGITWPLHTESSHAIRKLRDVIDLKTRMLPISSSSPRSASTSTSPPQENPNENPTVLDDEIAASLPDPNTMEGNIQQMVMTRVYNRWIIEFDDEDGARRFARLWDRRVLPQPRFVTWRDEEEVRMVSAEFLW